MGSSTELADTKSEFSDLIAELQRLSRDLLLAFRITVGKMILDHFFEGSAHTYTDRSHTKDQKFAAFLAECGADLADLGLREQTLRNCVRARITYDTLPPAVREKLKLSQVVELTRVGDPTTRARLAHSTVSESWTVNQLKNAIVQAKIGNFYDTDAATPGTQPPPSKPVDEPKYQAGRLISQLVKASRELAEWQRAWQSIDLSKLRASQKKDLKAAVMALQQRIAALQALLGQ